MGVFMNRRHFVGLSMFGAGAVMMLPKLILAGLPESPLAGGVFYTKDHPGRWIGKAGGHVPVIAVEKREGDVKIQVTTPHEMKGHEHYIIKHILLDQKYGFIQEKLFDPSKDKAAVSEFTLKDYSGPLYTLSLCNLHDLWLNMIEV